MKFLVIGLGSIGTRHYNNLIELGANEIAVLRSRNLSPPAELTEKPAHIFSDYVEALKWGPHAVVVANPTAFHFEYTKKAIEAGCHVYLEKPVSHTLDGIEDLIRLQKEMGAHVFVGCQLRFHPNLLDIRKWLDLNLLGDIYSVSVDMGEYLPNWHPWEDYRTGYAARKDQGGGVVLTQIHELDYIYWLFGMASKVFALGGKRTNLELSVEDTALVLLETAKRIPVQLRMDYWRDPGERKMSVVGEKGEIQWDYMTGKAVLKDKNGILKTSDVPDTWERNDLFLSTMKHFLNVMDGSQDSRISLFEGYEVLKIADSIKKSISQQRMLSI